MVQGTCTAIGTPAFLAPLLTPRTSRFVAFFLPASNLRRLRQPTRPHARLAEEPIGRRVQVVCSGLQHSTVLGGLGNGAFRRIICLRDSHSVDCVEAKL